MKLRGRLFVRNLVQAIPIALLIMFVGDYFRLRDMEDSLRQYVSEQLASGAAERCATDPERLGPPRPPARGGRPNGPPPEGPPGRGRGVPPPGGPYELFAYTAAFTPADPQAPVFPSGLRDGLASGSRESSMRFWTLQGRGIAMAVPLGDASSACAYLVVRMLPRRGTLFDQFIAFTIAVVVTIGAGWLAMGRVITRLRDLAESVRQSAASHYEQPVQATTTASDEIDDLAHAFNAAGTTVREHLVDVKTKREALRRFVANTTHDVAMPLTVLQGHLVELERTTPSGSPEFGRVREAMQEAHYMGSLLRNLGAAARLDEEAAALQRHPVDLNALVERVVARHHTLARARGVHLDFAVPDPPITAASDITLLEQAVSNLADNAVQYNRPGGHVAIVLDRVGQDRFRLRVADDGPGIEAAELERLTERRFRGSDARTRRPEGQGLGLAILAEAVERLGLELRFERSAEGGLAAEISGSL